MVEVWKVIPGYDGWYEVSDRGRVRSYAPVGRKPKGVVLKRATPIVLKPSRSKKGGYVQVDLQYYGERKIGRIHRLVAEAFLGDAPFEGALVMHKDDDVTNNHYQNLSWGTTGDNVADKVAKGRHPKASASVHAKLKDSDIPKIRGYFASGYSISDIGRMFGVSPATISDVVKGNTWKSIQGVEMP